MSDEQTVLDNGGMTGYLKARVSRAQLLAAAGAGLALAIRPGAAGAAPSAGAPGLSFPFFPQVKGSYTTEGLQDIFNWMTTFVIAKVTEHHAILVLDSPPIPFNALELVVVQAEVAIEQYHLDFLQSLGGVSLESTFARAVTPHDPVTFFKREELNNAGNVSLWMTAAREFAELGQPLLVKYAFQIGAVYAELRVLSRGALAIRGVAGEVPPNNVAFEPDQFLYIRDFYNFVKKAGLFTAGGPQSHTYPGRAAALAAAGPMAALITQKTP